MPSKKSPAVTARSDCRRRHGARPETARTCILAGAQSIVSPTGQSRHDCLLQTYSIPVLPGALTPSEVLDAWTAGADFVKVFQRTLGGASYIKALKAPLPQIELVPTGAYR